MAKCPPFRFPYRLGDLWAPMWRDTLQMLDDNYQRSEAAQPEAASDNIGVGMDSPANDVDRALSAALDELLTKLEDRDRAIEDWLEHCVGGGTGALRFHTLVVAASNSLDLDPTHYDFLCTGSNDHRTINAALAALPAAGEVILMEGTYNVQTTEAVAIEPPLGHNGVTLAGQGRGTIIRKSAGQHFSQDIISSPTSGAGFEIRDLLIDGADSVAQGELCNGITLTAPTTLDVTNGSSISNIYFVNINEYCVVLRGNVVNFALSNLVFGTGCVSGINTIDAVGNAPRHGTISDIIGDGYTGDGLVLDAVGGGWTDIVNCDFQGGQRAVLVRGTPTDLHFANVSGNSQSIIAFDIAGSNPTRLTFVKCTATNCAGNGFELNSLNDSGLTACVATNNGGHGFLMESSGGASTFNDSSLVGCKATDNAGDGFLWSGALSGTLNYNQMQQCMARRNGSFGCQLAGGSVVGTLVVNNDFHTGGTAGSFSDTATGSVLTLPGPNSNRT